MIFSAFSISIVVRPIDHDPLHELAVAKRRIIDAVSSEVGRKMSSVARFLSFRQLRHLAITRILKQGVPPMMAAELTATSREMLDQTYGHLYKVRGRSSLTGAA